MGEPERASHLLFLCMYVDAIRRPCVQCGRVRGASAGLFTHVFVPCNVTYMYLATVGVRSLPHAQVEIYTSDNAW